MIKNILYDYGYVLAYPRSGNWFFPKDTYRIMGIRNTIKMLLRKARFSDSFHKAHGYLNENHTLYTEEEELEQFQRFYKIFFHEMGIRRRIDRISEQLAKETVCSDEKVCFYEDVKLELAKAHESCKVAILSDTWPSLRRLLEHQGIMEHLDGAIMSCDYGICKDNRKLFEITISMLNIVPEETVFVDDSEANLDNAFSMGIISVLMDRSNKIKQSRYPIVHNLNELYQFVMEYNNSLLY